MQTKGKMNVKAILLVASNWMYDVLIMYVDRNCRPHRSW